MVIQKIDPSSKNTKTTDFIKDFTNRDELKEKRKFGQILNFRSDATLLLVSNATMNSFKAFNDPAIYQRLGNTLILALKDAFRV